MTKSELFKTAHQVTKNIRQAGDDYRTTFGLVLKALYAGWNPKEMTLKEIVKEINASLPEKHYAKIWEGKGKTRIYINLSDRRKTNACYYEINGRKAVKNGKNFGLFDRDGKMDLSDSERVLGADVLLNAGYEVVAGR